MGEDIETKYKIIDYRKDPDDGRVLVQVDWLENKKGRAFMDITEWVNKTIDQAEQRGKDKIIERLEKYTANVSPDIGVFIMDAIDAIKNDN